MPLDCQITGLQSGSSADPPGPPGDHLGGTAVEKELENG